MAALPAVFQDGKTLEKDGPWYLMGLVRRHFRWQGESRSAMIAFETVLFDGSGVLDCSRDALLYWLRYLPRQDFRGTLLHVFLMTLSWPRRRVCLLLCRECFARVTSVWPKSKNILRMILGTTRAALTTACIPFLFSLGVNRGLPFDRSTAAEESTADVRRWAAMVFQSVGYRRTRI